MRNNTIVISLLSCTVSHHNISSNASAGQLPCIHDSQTNQITTFSQQFENLAARNARRVINSQSLLQTDSLRSSARPVRKQERPKPIGCSYPYPHHPLTVSEHYLKPAKTHKVVSAVPTACDGKSTMTESMRSLSPAPVTNAARF